MNIVSIHAMAIDCGFQSQSLQTSRVASPMSRFPRFGERRASWMWPTKKTFVRVVSDDGTIGWSCTNGGEIVAMIINEHLSRLLTGQTCDDLADIWDQMAYSLLPSDRSGFVMMALAGVDIALWDLKAKSAGLALVDLLGGSQTDSLKVYATTPDPESHRNRAWSGLKAAAPYGPEAGAEGLAANVAFMQKFREAVGPDTPIMVDAFMAWDADYTLWFYETSQHLNLHWIEDPLPPYDYAGMRKLKRELGDDVLLALGNFAFNRWDCGELLDQKLADILQPDVAWAGGITEALRILDMAKAADVPVILHNTCEQPWALALAAAAQTDPWVEFVDRGATSQLYSLMGEPAQIAGGVVEIPRDPLGNTPQRDIAQQFMRFDAPSKKHGS